MQTWRKAKLEVKKQRAKQKAEKSTAACARMQTWRKRKLEAEKQRTEQKAEANAAMRARKAARTHKSYTPRANASERLQSIAAQAYAAEQIAIASHEVAEGALSEAAEAKSVAAGAKEVSDAAHSLAVDAAKRVLNIQEQLSEGKESLRKTQEQLSEGNEALRKTQEELSEGKEALKEAFLEAKEELRKTHALAEKNAERLDADDRKRGYCTPVHKSVP